MRSIEGESTGSPGIFITLEGPDGAGKTSQQRLLVDRLAADADREVVATREPGGTPLGERIRAILLESDTAHDPVVDALLFSAARRALVAETIGPALARGAVVVCDRFADSTLAYQGYGGGGPMEDLVALGAAATGGLSPTRTVLLDLDIAAGLSRRQGGPEDELTRFETSDDHDREFHERVREGYLTLAETEPERWRIVDASGTPERVAELIWDAVRDLFEEG